MGGVEPKSASYDESYPVVESFHSAVVDPEFYGSEDACAVLLDGAPGCDERLKSGTLGP